MHIEIARGRKATCKKVDWRILKNIAVSTVLQAEKRRLKLLWKRRLQLLYQRFWST